MNAVVINGNITDQKFLEQVPIRELRGVGLARALNFILRLNRKWHPLLTCFNGSHDLVRIPFSGYELVHPAAWRKELTAYLLAGENTVPEFKLMRRLLQDLPPGAVVDVGANMGLYVLLIRSMTSAPIVAFEPVPFLFDLMRRNILCNKFRDIDTRQQACGAHAGIIQLAAHMNAHIVSPSQELTAPYGSGVFNEDAKAARSEDRLTTAPMVTLDEAMGDQIISLVKIDCEGYELEVLRGAVDILNRDRPRLFIEVHPALLHNYQSSVEELLDFLSPEYEMEFWDFEQARHVSKFARSWRKHRPNTGLQLPHREAFIAACTTSPLPAQLYIVGIPRV